MYVNYLKLAKFSWAKEQYSWFNKFPLFFLGFFFFCGLGPFFVYLYHISIGSVLSVILATDVWTLLSLLAAWPSSGLKVPQWCGVILLYNLFGVRPRPTERGLYTLSPPPPGHELTTTVLAPVEI